MTELKMDTANGDELTVGDVIDSDGEIEVYQEILCDCDRTFYISKENAEKLINHLTNVFSIGARHGNKEHVCPECGGICSDTGYGQVKCCHCMHVYEV